MALTDGRIRMLTGTNTMAQIRLCRTGMTGGVRKMAILPAEILSPFMVRGNQNDGRKNDYQ